MTTVAYRVKDAGAQTVAAWYMSHVPGGISVTIPAADQSVVEVFQPGGHAAATISQIHFDPKLASAAKSLGADSTLLGIETFDPPMSPDTIDMVRSAANGLLLIYDFHDGFGACSVHRDASSGVLHVDGKVIARGLRNVTPIDVDVFCGAAWIARNPRAAHVARNMRLVPCDDRGDRVRGLKLVDPRC